MSTITFTITNTKPVVLNPNWIFDTCEGDFIHYHELHVKFKILTQLFPNKNLSDILAFIDPSAHLTLTCSKPKNNILSNDPIRSVPAATQQEEHFGYEALEESRR